MFPLSSVYWPGSEATLQIIDPAYRKMYLHSKSMRFAVVGPLGRTTGEQNNTFGMCFLVFLAPPGK